MSANPRFARPRPARAVLGAVCAVLAAAALCVAPGASTSAPASAAARPKILATYYLWWSLDHWKSMLGPNYPTNAARLPLPATLDASGCHPVSKYAGNHLTDVPGRLYSQDTPGQIASDVQEAASAGLSGFIVNWAGSGAANQTAASTVYSRRLQVLVQAVHKLNAAGTPFTLWLSYKASASHLATSAISNDLGYFVRAYGRDPAFDHSNGGRPTVIWQGSRKYPTSALAAIHRSFGSSLRILGDESSWNMSRAPFLEGDAYYWSSQNPWTNPQSFAQLAKLASTVRSSPRNANGTVKAWISPVIPGYDKQLAGGSTCVPRKQGATLRKVFDGNLRTNPEAWDLISWNEITEGSYIDPMTRYGRQDLNVAKSIVATGH
jgi:hypothetical protein